MNLTSILSFRVSGTTDSTARRSTSTELELAMRIFSPEKFVTFRFFLVCDSYDSEIGDPEGSPIFYRASCRFDSRLGTDKRFRFTFFGSRSRCIAHLLPKHLRTASDFSVATGNVYSASAGDSGGVSPVIFISSGGQHSSDRVPRSDSDGGKGRVRLFE